MTRIFTRLHNALLFGGLDAEEYRELEPDIQKENRKNLATYASVAVAAFGILAITSVVTRTFASENAVAYVICCLLCGAILVCLKKAPNSALVESGVLDYVFSFVLYGFSLWITLLHPEYPAVSAIVILPVIPLLFMKKPIRLAMVTALDVALFCVLSYSLKSWPIAITDIWNAVSFGMLAISVAVIIVCMRVRGFSQSKRVLYLGSHDILTGLKNRNCYEEELAPLAASARLRFGCIYADANGLHELNNNRGHAEGDALLRCVASSMKDAFGSNTYRVGGDEFVCLVVDEDENDVRKRLAEVKKRIEANGYSSSLGYASMPAPIDSDPEAVVQLVKDAEAEMFARKGEHYSRRSNDRRRR